MKPIAFTCRETLPLPTENIAEQILDLTKWPAFRGFGPIPGIKSAEFEARTSIVVGSRIRVTNLDGSSHVEEIVVWQPNRRLQLQMGNFSKPLAFLATGFLEIWEFEREGNETKVSRSFELTATSIRARPLLWLIAFFLKQAVRRHLAEMKRPGPTA